MTEAPQWTRIRQLNARVAEIGTQIGTLNSERNDHTHALSVLYAEVAEWHLQQIGGEPDAPEARQGQQE